MLKKVLVFSILLLMSVVVIACGSSSGSSDNGDFKVGLALTGSKTDGGWCQTAYEGVKMAEDQLGATVLYNENTQAADYEKILRDYGKEGCHVIIGHGYEFTDGAKVVAEEFPDTKFIVTSTNIENGKNLGSIELNDTQAGFLKGVFAANMTKTDAIGGLIAQEIPPLRNDLKGFAAGAKYVNPEVKVLSAVTGSFEDINKMKEQTTSLLDQGADICFVNGDNAARGTYDAARAKGLYAIGSIAPEYSMYPETLIACGDAEMNRAIYNGIKSVKEGTFEGKYYLSGIEEDIVSFSYNPALENQVPDDVKKAVSQAIEDIKSGKLDINQYL